MDNKTPRKNKLYKSFGYAFEGIFNTIFYERNMQIHSLVTVLVVIFGIILKISMIEWFICMLLFAIVLSLELVNTAIEAVVDLVTEEKKPLAKKAKDAAAGAVLISAIFAAIMGGIIFFPKLWAFLF
ncbi:diacylglycerol kinase family protein [Butyrivibrio sp. XPD2002]|uniref:diacylglycerol kinase family protein n=1 Tax=Butyrivibrio sp. XPD2002 TaxID=1280665 RepID=UPI00040FF2E8|nr:diacylglycerol kinase family protein [Butyrivibrio sp. XPD2002]MCR5342315.1 diacylglycerol kinase family protein [Butyrivibrio sp.]